MVSYRIVEIHLSSFSDPVFECNNICCNAILFHLLISLQHLQLSASLEGTVSWVGVELNDIVSTAHNNMATITWYIVSQTTPFSQLSNKKMLASAKATPN